jgi:hypothetical protein
MTRERSSWTHSHPSCREGIRPFSHLIRAKVWLPYPLGSDYLPGRRTHCLCCDAVALCYAATDLTQRLSVDLSGDGVGDRECELPHFRRVNGEFHRVLPWGQLAGNVDLQDRAVADIQR